jgi:D-3-phosphoglycerate dehydrogenase
VEIPIHGHLLLIRNQDRPGIVGFLGTVLGRHGVNIANMSLSRDDAGGEALTVLHLDSVPPAEALAELQEDQAITSVRVVSL